MDFSSRLNFIYEQLNFFFFSKNKKSHIKSWDQIKLSGYQHRSIAGFSAHKKYKAL